MKKRYVVIGSVVFVAVTTGYIYYRFGDQSNLSKYFTPHILVDDVPSIGFHG